MKVTTNYINQNKRNQFFSDSKQEEKMHLNALKDLSK
jgi:hypothetical protein